MDKIVSFLLGAVVGAAGLFVALKYHVVRAGDGMHLVPKLSAQFSEAYVDVRGFGLAEWDSHRSLAAALVQADKGHILQHAASEGLRRSMHDVLDTLTGRKPVGGGALQSAAGAAQHQIR